MLYAFSPKSWGDDRPLAKKYLEQLTVLMGPVTSGKFKHVNLEYKHFFSGAAVYADGRICITLTPAGFALKLPEEPRNRLMKQKGTKPLRYFPEGPIKKEYVVLPETILEDPKTLGHWVKVSIEYVLVQPKPVKRNRK